MKNYIYKLLFILFLYLLEPLLVILLSYSSHDYTFYYAITELFLYFLIPAFFLVLAFKNVYAIWKYSDLGWLKQLKSSVIVSLPILTIKLCFIINPYLYEDPTTHILKLHSAKYEKDVKTFYQENVGKVALGKYVYKERHFPFGFPAYRARYQLEMNADSTYNLLVQYNVNPFNSIYNGYLYYSGDTTDSVLTYGYSSWGKEKRHLWGNWYFYSYL